MADLFDIVAQQAVTEFVPPSSTRQVHEITARAKPSGVVFTFRVSKGDYTPQVVGLVAHDLAQVFNKAADVPGVAFIQEGSDITAENTIARDYTIGVESTSGDSSTEIAVTLTTLETDAFAGRVEAARAKLDAIEAL